MLQMSDMSMVRLPTGLLPGNMSDVIQQLSLLSNILSMLISNGTAPQMDLGQLFNMTRWLSLYQQLLNEALLQRWVPHFI
jgi:hypothetical protein